MKNYWNTYLSKKIQGTTQFIDPNSHDSFNNDNDNDNKKDDDTELCLPGDSQFCSESIIGCLEGSRKERGESCNDTNLEKEDSGNFSLERKSLMEAANSAAFIFDDEILTPYWDSVPFLEAFDCTGEETTYPQVNFQSIFP